MSVRGVDLWSFFAPNLHMMRLHTVKHLTRLPTLLRTPLCRRCTSGAPSEYLQEPSEKQLAYAEALAEQVHSVAGRGCTMCARRASCMPPNPDTQVGVDMPDDVRTDQSACSAFIDEQRARWS